MSRTKMSPWSPIVNACKTSDTASGIVMKNLVISGCVIVMRLSFSICSLNTGITLPCDPSTLPNLTETQRMFFLGLAARMSSPSLLVAPMKLVGCTALSDEIKTNASQPHSSATSSKGANASTLLFSAPRMLSSTSGTCL